MFSPVEAYVYLQFQLSHPPLPAKHRPDFLGHPTQRRVRRRKIPDRTFQVWLKLFQREGRL
ncbi:MAG: hypothetical protein SGJ01_05470 [Gemmatimonadota bacterium]|nr:hypothetical protein [Gemmatimonadota bacterium]